VQAVAADSVSDEARNSLSWQSGSDEQDADCDDDCQVCGANDSVFSTSPHTWFVAVRQLRVLCTVLCDILLVWYSAFYAD